MVKIKTILKEMGMINEQRKYEFGCAMLFLDFPELDTIHNLINPDDLYHEDGEEYGLESEPHLTLLFGLHEGVSTDAVKSVLKDKTFSECKAHNISLFENEKYDVLKFDIEGDGLHKVNKELRKLPYTSTFPNYHPHMTIAYMKPGTGNAICEKLEGKEYWLPPKHAVYSKPDGTKDSISIKKE